MKCFAFQLVLLLKHRQKATWKYCVVYNLYCFLASIQNGTVNVTGLPGQKGEQGIQGITGAQGDTGQNGTQGQVSHPFQAQHILLYCKYVTVEFSIGAALSSAAPMEHYFIKGSPERSTGEKRVHASYVPILKLLFPLPQRRRNHCSQGMGNRELVTLQ